MTIHSNMTDAVVYIVDSDPASEAAYQTLINGMELKMQFHSSPDRALLSIPPDQPSCLVMELRSDNNDGLQLQRQLIQRDNPIPVILTTTDDQCQQAIEGLSLGALAVLGRPFSVSMLGEFLRYGIWQHRFRIDMKHTFQEINAMFMSLTQRQREILDLALTGLPNKAIASRLHVSQRTVEADRSALLRCFKATSFHDVAFRVGQFRTMDKLRQSQQRESSLRMTTPVSSLTCHVVDA